MSDPSGPGSRVIVVIHNDFGQGWVRLMAEEGQRTWTGGAIVENEAPLAGVDNVISMSYGIPCPDCGETLECFCRNCDHEGAA